MYPQIRIDLTKFRHNLRTLVGIAEKGSCSLMIVTKGFCADPVLVDEILKNDSVRYLADSRVQNLKTYAEKVRGAGRETVLLRLPQLCEIEEVVRWADISQNSEIGTIRLLNTEAERQGRMHKVILMIDEGDLREGMFYTDEDAILEVCREILSMKHIVFEGIGVNLTCYGAIIPRPENLGRLCALAEKIEKAFDIQLPIVSGGNSSSVYLIGTGELPARISNLRLGESVILGNDTANCVRIPDTFHDAFTLRAQIVELKRKPSLPIGDVGVDAFGEVPHYEDRGIITRAILAVGKQDMNPDGLTPLDTKAEILGGSSDHLILDVSAENCRLGDTVDFSLDYGALLKLFTSSYVERVYLGRE